ISAFDTRFAKDEHGFGLKVLMNTIGFAAEKIAKSLQNKGGTLVVPAEGFIVTGREGPLKKGELERAAEWAREIAKKKNRVMH
ncbi:MAG: Flavodoxin, partial [Candidatus Roizmanbacteria bacterium GW2011_GWA1_41_13]